MRKVWLSLTIWAVLSLLYATAFVFVAYGLLAGDRRDGAPPAAGLVVLV